MPDHPTRRWVVTGVVCAILVLGHPRGSPAEHYVRVDGWVQWIGGMRMQVSTIAGTVAIDLRQADQVSYRGLRAGDRIIVDGVVSSDRRTVVARQIWTIGSGIEAP
jgi:hypothetical protein